MQRATNLGERCLRFYKGIEKALEPHIVHVPYQTEPATSANKGLLSATDNVLLINAPVDPPITYSPGSFRGWGTSSDYNPQACPDEGAIVINPEHPITPNRVSPHHPNGTIKNDARDRRWCHLITHPYLRGLLNRIPSYPESPDLSLALQGFQSSNKKLTWPSEFDSLAEEMIKVEGEHDRSLEEEDIKIYLYRNNNLSIHRQPSQLHFRQQSLATKVLNESPIPYYREEEKAFAGIPITIVLVRVRKLNDQPNFRRANHVNPKKKKRIARRGGTKWLEVVVSRHSLVPYSCNIAKSPTENSIPTDCRTDDATLNTTSTTKALPTPRIQRRLISIGGAASRTATYIKLDGHSSAARLNCPSKLAIPILNQLSGAQPLPFGWNASPPVVHKKGNCFTSRP